MIGAAFRALAGRDGTPAELQAAQGVSMVEGYDHWKHLDFDPHNWFAVQTRRGKHPCFSYLDRHEDGSPYAACFKRYPSDAAGIADGVQVLYFRKAARAEDVLGAASSGSALTFATAQRASGYFELSANEYAEILASNVRRLAKAMGEPVYLAGGGSSGGGSGLALLGLGALAVLALRGRRSRAGLLAAALPP